MAERDVGGLLLTPMSGSTLTGRVVTDDWQTPPFPVGSIRVTIGRGPGPGFLGSVAAIAPDWNFTISNIFGSYVFRLSQLPSEWIVKTVRLNGTDVTDRLWELPRGGSSAGDLEIVISRTSGAVTGDVQSMDGRPAPSKVIVLFPDDPALWFHESRFIRNGRADSRARFELKGLPAGRYRITAVDSISYEQWWDPEYLARLRPDATRVDVSEGGTAAVTIRLPWDRGRQRTQRSKAKVWKEREGTRISDSSDLARSRTVVKRIRKRGWPDAAESSMTME